MLLNFYEEDNLQIGKEIIDAVLANDNAKFIQNFQQVIFEKPDVNDRSALTRYNRRVLAYRALLSKAGFKAPANLKPRTEKLFNAKLIEALKENDGDKAGDYASAAAILSKSELTWQQLHTGPIQPRQFHIRERVQSV